MEKTQYDVVIIGAGPGGLTAAMYMGRAGLATVVLDRGTPGGQMLTTELIENYPGFPNNVTGAELSELLIDHAKRWGAELAIATVKEFSDRGPDGYITVSTDTGDVRCRAIIIGTGAQPKKLGFKGEDEFYGRGVSYCALCDGNFYRNRDVCVVGGGDSAVEEAVYLSNIAKTVTVIHRRDELRARKVARDAAFARSNICFAWSTVVEEVFGEQFVTGVRVRELKTDRVTEITCDGVFFYVGITPITDFLHGRLEVTNLGFIKTDAHLQTSMPGVYAVGDVRREQARQVATAVGDGADAAVSVQHFLLEYPW